MLQLLAGSRQRAASSPRPPPKKQRAQGPRAARRQSKVPPYIMLPDGQARGVWIQLQLVVAMYIIWVTPIRVVSCVHCAAQRQCANAWPRALTHVRHAQTASPDVVSFALLLPSASIVLLLLRRRRRRR